MISKLCKTKPVAQNAKKYAERRIKIKKIAPLFLLIIILSCASHDDFFMSESSAISFIVDSLGHLYLEDSDANLYLIDTGATHSLLIRDRVNVSAKMRGFKIANRGRLAAFVMVDSLNINGLVIKKHHFAMMPSRKTMFANNTHTNVAGIIGMDILSQRHSFFDNVNRKLYLSSTPNDTLSSCMSIFYSRMNRPLVSLSINETTFNNILFDTGYNQFLRLQETKFDIIRSMMPSSERQTELTNIFNNRDQLNTITFDSLYINDIRLDGELSIQFNSSTQLLGSAFVLPWQAFAINPKAKMISFYK